MTRVDPRQPDPNFPDRPTHVDFFDLSEVIQDIDERSQGENILAILGVDLESLTYLARARIKFTTGSETVHSNLLALYLDAFTLGRLYEQRTVTEDAEQ